MFVIEDVVIEVVEDKIHKVRDHRLAALLFHDSGGIVVGVRMVLEQDFAHQAHARLALLGQQGQTVKLPDHGKHVQLKTRNVS